MVISMRFKKIIIAFLVIIVLLYLAGAFYSSNKKWINGITREEEIKGEMLIW